MGRPHDWTAENIATVRLKLKEFAETTGKKEVLKRMRLIASRMVDYIDENFDKGSNQFPEYTANLHDATGIAIYADGRLDKFLPTKRATSAQEGPTGQPEWGAEELDFAISQLASRFSTGLWLVMFSASSYAEHIERMGSPKDRGRNFFTTLWEILSIDIQDTFGTAIVGMDGLARF
mgnify:CR=1 FL=1